MELELFFLDKFRPNIEKEIQMIFSWSKIICAVDSNYTGNVPILLQRDAQVIPVMSYMTTSTILAFFLETLPLKTVVEIEPLGMV